MLMFNKAKECINNTSDKMQSLYSEIVNKMVEDYQSNSPKDKQENIINQLSSFNIDIGKIMQDALDIYYNNDSNDVAIELYDYLEYMDTKEFLTQLENNKFEEYIHNGTCIESMNAAYSIVKFKDNTYNAVIQETANLETTCNIVFENNFTDLKECIIETCKLCKEIRIWHDYCLLCEYIDNMYNEEN